MTTLLSLVRDNGRDARGHASGQVALDALRQFDPDVVISDIAMPNVNGVMAAAVAAMFAFVSACHERPLSAKSGHSY